MAGAGREGTGPWTKWVKFQVFLSCPKKRSKLINIINPLNNGFLHIQEIQNYSKVQLFNQSLIVSLHRVNAFNIKNILINKTPLRNLVQGQVGIMSAESSYAAGQHFHSREQSCHFQLLSLGYTQKHWILQASYRI